MLEVVLKLREVLGNKKVISDENQMLDYFSDMAGFEGKPIAIVKATSELDVQQAVLISRQFRIPIVPRGAGSSLTGASIADNSIMIDMRAMNKIVKIDKINWYVQVQPGVTITELNEELEKHGFFFPPDPASSYICTIGGAIAEDSGGMRCLKYGTVKDWVLSLRVVLPNGNIVQLGEPLRKNRAGYDLVHLFTGSEGTLGIITEASLKIIPIPKIERKRYLVSYSNWEDACRTIIDLRSSGLLPDIFEFLDLRTVSLINKVFNYGLDEEEATVLIDIELNDVELAEKIFNKNNAKKVRVAKSKEEEEKFYSARAVAYLAVKASSSGVWAEDIVVPIEKLAEYLAFVKKIESKYNVIIPVGGHAGDGNVHPTIMYDKNDAKSFELAKAVYNELCRVAISLGGSVSGEHGIGLQKAELMREQIFSHNGEEVLKIMKGIKKLVDPENLMNPGKYVGLA